MPALLLTEEARGATSEAVELRALTQAAGEGLATTQRGTPVIPHQDSRGMATRGVVKVEEATTITMRGMEEEVVATLPTRASNKALTVLPGQILVSEKT